MLDNDNTNSVDSTETKQYELPICGITGKPLEWGQRTWISTYVKGKRKLFLCIWILKQFVLYIDKVRLYS